MAQRTLFLGFRRDVPALLGAADVFLFPSFQEGLPVSLMEAMAAGLPCLVSRVRGNRDLIQNGEGGRLREPLDAEGFAEDLAELLKAPGQMAEMGRRNRQVIQGYGLEKVQEHMAALYRQQMNREEAH